MTAFERQTGLPGGSIGYCGLVAQLVKHRAATLEIVSSTPAGPTLRVLK